MKILFLIIICQVLSQSCLNGAGIDVDWWFILKMPNNIKNYYETELTNGYEYFYCDSINNCTVMEYVISPSIKDPTSPLMRTVDQISFISPTTMSIAWNDQQFSRKYAFSSKAHSKGILSASNTQGFIINHSLPKFPMINSSTQKIILDMHTNAEKNGQHFFCVTMLTSEIDKVAELYWNAQIIVQVSNQLLAFQYPYPNIFKLNTTNIRPNRYTETLDHLQVFSKGRFLQLEVIAKPQRLKQDFYQYVVAEKLDVDLIMETWGRGKGRLQDPMCRRTGTSFRYQILSNMCRLDQTQYNIPYTKDHSKYGISLNDTKKYVCVSDINRQPKQYLRGGTAICFIHPELWELIGLSFAEKQVC